MQELHIVTRGASEWRLRQDRAEDLKPFAPDLDYTSVGK